VSTPRADDPSLRAAKTAEAPFREWKYMTGAEIAEVDRDRAVVMVTCSPLEVHGPHLPTITDTLEAEALGVRTMELLKERHPEMELLRLPPIYTAADVLPHPGSIAFRSSSVRRVMTDLGRSLAKQGFRNIWVGNFHGGPRHFVPIEAAAHTVNRRYGGRMVSMFSLLIARLTQGSSDLSDVLADAIGLAPEELHGDSHGGAVETSMMLHLIGEHVSPAYASLARRTVNVRLRELGKRPLPDGSDPGLRELMRGFREKLTYYFHETYSGAPALATPERGERIIDVLAGHTADALSEVYTGALSPDDCHSPLWPVRHVFLSEPLSWVFERLMGYESRVF